MNKRIALGMALILMVLVLLSLPTTAQKKVTLTYWHPYGGEWKVYHESIVNVWNAVKPYWEVKVLSVPGDTIRDKLMTAITGGNPPDVCYIWGTFDLHVLPKYFTPLNEFIEKDPAIAREDFLPSVLELSEYKGTLYGLPACGAAMAVYYNKGLFRQAGLDPNQPPKFWDELELYAEKLTRKDAAGRYEVIGYVPWQGGWWNFAYFWQNGGKTWDPEGQKVTIADDPKNLESLRWLVSWAKKYDAEKVTGFLKQAQVAAQATFADPFCMKVQALQFQGIWHISEIRAYAPDIDFDVFELPYPRGGKPVNPVYADTFFIPKGTKNSKEAWEFLKFMTLVGSSITTSVGGDIPARSDFLHLPAFTKNPLFMKIAEYAKHNYEVRDMPVLQFYKDQFTAAIESAIYLQKTPEKALRDLQDMVQREVNRVIGRK